ncbi:MAG: enoyl-CoA hydratase/isomerase family protein [Dehalococcoidia bacterium]|nr:enoyl-CoA hydratase/isomerase family protein [Dehalococcoidia bacterium]
MSSPDSPVVFEVNDGVATITLNRPEQMNTINGELGSALIESLREVRNRDDIRVAVITGNGRAFCAGADLRSRADGPAAASGVAGCSGRTTRRVSTSSTRRNRLSALSTGTPLVAASKSLSRVTSSSPAKRRPSVCRRSPSGSFRWLARR